MLPRLKEIAGIGVVPVLKSQNVSVVLKVTEILARQALPAVEIALRSSSSLELVRQIKQQNPKMIVGVSNVLTADQIEEAEKAGADFISTVHVNAALIESCLARNLPVVPECPTAVDIEHAQALGLDCVKLLSGTPLADLKMVKELKERYHGMHFMITAGIARNEIVNYLDLSCIVACCTAGQLREKDLETADFDQIEKEVAKFVKELLGMELAHVGVNGTSAQDAFGIAEQFGTLLEENVLETPISYFAGESVEIMKNGRGVHGHIGYRVNNVARAMHHFQLRGYHFVPQTFKKNEEGEIIFAYFEEEIGGFAVHLSQKQ